MDESWMTEIWILSRLWRILNLCRRCDVWQKIRILFHKFRRWASWWLSGLTEIRLYLRFRQLRDVWEIGTKKPEKLYFCQNRTDFIIRYTQWLSGFVAQRDGSEDPHLSSLIDVLFFDEICTDEWKYGEKNEMMTVAVYSKNNFQGKVQNVQRWGLTAKSGDDSNWGTLWMTL